ncbi:hypothetical protein Tco_0262835, partial [Tanacetum coccineum]
MLLFRCYLILGVVNKARDWYQSQGYKEPGQDEEEEEEKEHLALADSAIVVPVDEPVFPPEGTEPV